MCPNRCLAVLMSPNLRATDAPCELKDNRNSTHQDPSPGLTGCSDSMQLAITIHHNCAAPTMSDCHIHCCIFSIQSDFIRADVIFRSAYFRLGRMLRENIPCRAVLALTATATKATEASMVQALGISPSAVFRDASLRDNLRFHVHHTNGGTHLLLSAKIGCMRDDHFHVHHKQWGWSFCHVEENGCILASELSGVQHSVLSIQTSQ